MKRIILTVSFIMATCICMWADPISKQQAQQKAESFWLNLKAADPSHPHRIVSQTPSLTDAYPETSAYYIFNIGEADGFVIVSGDDRTEAILGYAETGSFSMDKAPENMKAWLKEYERQLAWLQSTSKGKRIHSPRKASKANIAPMTKSLWAQNKPYNLYCYNEKRKWYAVTGCVATAMAQIMYYHKWPQQTTAVIPAYTIKYNGLSILSYTWEEQPITQFNWSSMQDTYNSANDLTISSATAAEKAVAKLMRCCGQSVKMKYSNDQSSASSLDACSAFRNYFGYDEDTRLIQRDDYSSEAWEELIYNELSNERPVLYSGQTAGNTGHAFVVDGYKDGMYSINWGWGGNCNGYFLLDMLDPKDEGQTGSSSGAYNYGQDAIIGIQKPNGMDDVDKRLSIQEFTIAPDYYYKVSYILANKCGIEGNYDCAIVAIDQYGSVKKVLKEFYTNVSFSPTITRLGKVMPERESTDTEEYVITLGCKQTGESVYQPCIGWEGYRLTAQPDPNHSNTFVITEYTEDGSDTGIRSIPSVHDNDIYYNMNGQRVNHPTRGIYIKNGKIVFVE